MDEWVEEHYGKDYPLLIEEDNSEPWLKRDFWRPGK